MMIFDEDKGIMQKEGRVSLSIARGAPGCPCCAGTFKLIIIDKDLKPNPTLPCTAADIDLTKEQLVELRDMFTEMIGS